MLAPDTRLKKPERKHKEEITEDLIVKDVFGGQN
jgi:hypothetical protein